MSHKRSKLNPRPFDDFSADDTSNIGRSSDSLADSLLTEVLKSGNAENYELGKVVAKGGMGAIVDARDINIRRNVPMKVILDPDEADEKTLLRFVEEAQITGQLEHPGVVPVHQLEIDSNGNAFYTMKFVHGLTLGEIVKGLKTGDEKIIESYPLGRLLNVFLKVCDTIAFAHSKQVIHRDLKPDNIMVGEYGDGLGPGKSALERFRNSIGSDD